MQVFYLPLSFNKEKTMSLPIHFAPLQGYTDDVYRRLHHEIMGGITTY